MGRYNIEEVETDENDQIFDSGNRRFAERRADQPKRSPIRRKDKLREAEGVKSKVNRIHKKIQHRLKQSWQEE